MWKVKDYVEYYIMVEHKIQDVNKFIDELNKYILFYVTQPLAVFKSWLMNCFIHPHVLQNRNIDKVPKNLSDCTLIIEWTIPAQLSFSPLI